MRIYDIITKKRYGMELSKEEIYFVIDGYMKGTILDYQMSSLLMAICINSMSEAETNHLTRAMLYSGDTVDLSTLGEVSVDKHSTGGVGDKTTLIVAPIVAACGGKVAKMSGRGLGFTGGTIDKLESIEGFNTTLSEDEFLHQASSIGAAVIAQSGNLVPADKRLYALRDVTATVESIPLIASSIMSKKLASGAKSIVLDVKVGKGAFMKTKADAVRLASAMIKIGKGFNRNALALITNMDIPLGYCVGNSLEVYEAISVLKGKGEKRLTDVSIELSASMLSMALKIDIESARDMASASISNGKALDKLQEIIYAQGGNLNVRTQQESLVGDKYSFEYCAKRDGYISSINAEMVGTASMLLGAGRATKEDKINHRAGLIFKKSYGDYVQAGEALATLYSSDKGLFDGAIDILDKAITISENKPQEAELVYQIIK
ncbi:MAG: thymidine phosphorylase [Clostridia bacterium]|nr:thymidine phosphorylase [Clostridia bacterium]